jgi:hypothetical protein
MRNIILSFVILLASLTPTSAKKKKPAFQGADYAQIDIGPVTANGSDTPTDEFVDLNPQLIANRRYIFIEPRNQGFGGTTGTLSLSMSHKTLRFIRSKKKGILPISNKIIARKGSKKAPKRSIFLRIDYERFGVTEPGIITSVDQLETPYVISGKIKFRRVRRRNNLADSSNDAYKFLIKGVAKNVRVKRTSPTGPVYEILASVPIKGEFVVTFKESFFFKF